MSNWLPNEIIIHNKVKEDFVTKFILEQCPRVPISYTDSGSANVIKEKSQLLINGSVMLDQINSGKKIIYIAPPANDVVDVFEMPDNRLMCPHFDRLKLASNGCFFKCDWCYLKLTYRASRPFITVRADYDKIKNQLKNRLAKTTDNVIFNSGELADSLALEHLTRAGREFIPWFGGTENGFLFMLTKSDNVDDILGLDHNGHTVIAFSINAPEISRKFEIGAPSFERRLEAAKKVQAAGYPLRIRLDPIVPADGWQEMYAETIRRIFEVVSPERITLGTLRFEDQFYRLRDTFISSGPALLNMMNDMKPMFETRVFNGKKKSGKYSFSDEKRVEIFDFAISEIRKFSDCRIALCKESAEVWNRVGLDLRRCSCVCQLDYADMVDRTS